MLKHSLICTLYTNDYIQKVPFGWKILTDTDNVAAGLDGATFITINPISPNLRYKIAVAQNDSTKTLNVIDELNGSNNVIADIDGELKENMWNEQSDYLFAKFESKDSPDTTDLYVINLREMKLTKHFRSVGRKNFS